MKCPIDGEEMAIQFNAEVLGKYAVDYFRCPSCLLLQPQDPIWLAEAYSSAIAATDIGLISRNLGNLARLQPILQRLAPSGSKILDIGGGYGMLCRGLRDQGFDCYTSDLYCENLFAVGFEPDANFRALVLLAFEVFEHISDPRSFLQEALRKFDSETIVFSTLTYSSEAPPSLDWWYYAFETGQHVSLYHSKTLEILAGKLGVNYLALGPELHVMSRRAFSATDTWVLQDRHRFTRWIYGRLVRRMRKGKSLLHLDYEAAKEKLRNSK